MACFFLPVSVTPIWWFFMLFLFSFLSSISLTATFNETGRTCTQSFLVLTPGVVSCACASVFGISGQFLAPCSSRVLRPALNGPSLCWTPGTLFCLSHSSLIHPLHLFCPSFSSALKPECPFLPPLYWICALLSPRLNTFLPGPLF